MNKGITPMVSRGCGRFQLNNQPHGSAAFLRWAGASVRSFPALQSVQGEHGQEGLGRDVWVGAGAGDSPS